ncbi:MAG: class I adenylate-forming enzyme family protein, partial [Candidatus Omnitrophota bacterium]|nr:class I adenylate-forming enzyme family protein [Candidatus Omnitrophota bacterium]
NDRIAILLPNCREFALSYFANSLIGATSVPINPSYHEKDIKYILEATGARLVVTDSRHRDTVSRNYKIDGGAIYVVDFFLKSAGKPPAKGARKSFEFNAISDEDIAVISYTSGTTANPKGVKVSYGSIIANAGEFIAALQLDGDSVFYCPLSLAYMAGWYNLLFLPFLCRGRVVIDSTFNAGSLFTFWDNVIKYKVNVLWVVPTIMAILLAYKNDKAAEYCRVNIKSGLVGTAPLAALLKKKFEEEFHMTLYENYGLSELLFITTNHPRLPYKESSVGKPLKGCRIFILNDDGGECGPGEEGEIVIESGYAMKGYYGKEDEPAGRFINGRFYTGDMGKTDKDGYLFITGRKKDLIIKGGVNISPRAIEDVLLKYDPVQEAAVIGMRNEIYGEEIIAVIKLKDKHKRLYDEKKISEFCESSLARHQQPARFIVIDEMPKTASGKIQKDKLKILLARVTA